MSAAAVATRARKTASASVASSSPSKAAAAAPPAPAAVKPAVMTSEVDAASTKARAPAAKKAKASKEETPAAAQVAAETTAVAADADAAPAVEDDYEALVKQVQDEIKAMTRELVDAVAAAKTKSHELQKLLTRSIQMARTERKKSRRKTKGEKRPPNPNRKNTFGEEREVRPDVAAFLGLAPGQLISRVRLFSLIAKYVKDNNLKVEGSMVFKPDAALAKVLGPAAFPVNAGHTAEEKKQLGYSYKNLQQYITAMFLPKPDAAAASA